MSVPSYEDLMRPTLELLDKHGDQVFGDLIELVAQREGLSEEDRTLTIASGEPLVKNRVGWALTYLVQAGAVRRPKRGVSSITDRGRELLNSVSGPISKANLVQFPEFQAFLNRTRTRSNPGSATSPIDYARVPATADTIDVDQLGSPEEIIDRTVATVHSALAGEIVDRVMELTPVGFEQLVLRLLGAMGYGASGQIESTAESGDAGNDGVISQDPLGLDRIYVQAKRYARDRAIGRPAMQAFVGALQGQQADRGVFMATSSFTRDALEYADRVGVRIIPVDGNDIAQLMLKHGVGVQPGYQATLMRLDEDFFETL